MLAPRLARQPPLEHKLLWSWKQAQREPSTWRHGQHTGHTFWCRGAYTTTTMGYKVVWEMHH